MTSFACYTKPIKESLQEDLAKLKQSVAQGNKPEHEFLAHLQQVALMTHSNQSQKIASFAPHLFKQFSAYIASCDAAETNTSRSAAKPPQRAGSGKKAEKSAKQPAAGPSFELFRAPDPVISDESAKVAELDQTAAAARTYILAQYTATAFADSEIAIDSCVLELAVRSVSVFWAGFVPLENLYIQACSAVIRRLADVLCGNDVNLRLLVRERAEAFVADRKASQMLHYLLPANVKSGYEHVLCLINLFLGSLLFMWRSATARPALSLFNTAVRLTWLQFLFNALPCVALTVQTSFASQLLYLSAALLQDAQAYEQASLARVQQFQRLGDAVLYYLYTEEATQLAHELLGLKACPKDTEPVQAAYIAWLDSAQKRMLQYAELSLTVLRLAAALGVYGHCYPAAAEGASAIYDNLQYQFYDLPLAGEGIASFGKIALKFSQKDENQPYLDRFAYLPLLVSLIQANSKHFGFLVAQRVGGAYGFAAEILQASVYIFAYLNRIKGYFLQNASILALGRAKLQFAERFIEMLRLVAVALWQSPPVTDKKALDKKQPTSSDESRTAEQALSSTMAQYALPGQLLSAVPMLAAVKGVPDLQVWMHIAVYQLVYAVKSQFVGNILVYLLQIQLNSLLECHKTLNLVVSVEKEQKGKVVEERAQAAQMLANSSVPVTEALLLQLSEHCCDAVISCAEVSAYMQGLYAVVADFEAVATQFEAENKDIQRVTVNLQMIGLLIRKQNQQAEVEGILDRIAGYFTAMMQDATISAEERSRLEFDWMMRVVRFAALAMKESRVHVSKQLLRLYEADQVDFLAQSEVCANDCSSLREKLLMESIQKSILRESLAKSIGGQARKTQQPSTIVSLSKWRTAFLSLLLFSLTADHCYECVCNIANNGRDRPYVNSSADLQFLVVCALLQLGRISEIRELLENVLLPPAEYAALLTRVVRMLLNVYKTHFACQIAEVIGFCIYYLEQLCADQPNPTVEYFVAFVTFIRAGKSCTAELDQAAVQKWAETDLADYDLLQLMCVLFERQCCYQTLYALTAKLIGCDVDFDATANFRAQAELLRNSTLRAVACESDGKLVGATTLLSMLLDAGNYLAIPVMTHVLQLAVARPVSFSLFATLCEVLQKFIMCSRRGFGNSYWRFALEGFANYLNTAMFAQFYQYVDDFCARDPNFVYDVRVMQQKILNFAIFITFFGFYEKAQTIFQACIGSQAVERHLMEEYVFHFASSAQCREALVAEHVQQYISCCHFPRLLLSAAIKFSIGQFRAAYEAAMQCYPFLNLIYQRLACRIVAADLLGEQQAVRFDELLIPELESRQLALRLLTATAILIEADVTRLLAFFKQLEATDLRSVGLYCAFAVKANKVFACSYTIIGSQALEQRQWQFCVCEHLLLSCHGFPGAAVFEEFVQMQLQQQSSYICELPASDDIADLYNAMEVLAGESFSEEATILELAALIAAPNYSWKVLEQDKALPRVAGFQLLVQGRRLLIARIFAQQLSALPGNQRLHLVIAQINICLMRIAQDFPHQLSDTYFKGGQPQDAIITRYLATLTKDKDVYLADWLKEPYAYNISVLDLAGQVVDSLALCGFCEAQRKDHSLKGLVEEICRIDTPFCVSNGELQYKKTVLLYKAAERQEIGYKQKEQQQNVELAYANDVYASKLALYMTAELAELVLFQLLEYAELSENSVYELDPERKALFLSVAAALRKSNSRYAADYVALEHYGAVIEETELRLLRKLLYTLGLAFQANCDDRALLFRAFTVLLSIRKQQGAECGALDAAIFYAVSALYQDQFSVLAQAVTHDLLGGVFRLVEAYAQQFPGVECRGAKKQVDALAYFRLPEFDKAKKSGKNAQAAEQPQLRFCIPPSKGGVSDLLQKEFVAVEQQLSELIGGFQRVRAENMVLVAAFPAYGVLVGQNEVISDVSLGLENAALAAREAARMGDLAEDRRQARFYRHSVAKFAGVYTLLQEAGFEDQEEVMRQFEEFKQQSLHYSPQEAIDEDETHADAPHFAEFKSAVERLASKPLKMTVNAPVLFQLLQNLTSNIVVLAQRKSVAPLSISQPQLRLFDVLDDLAFASKNGQNYCISKPLQRLRELLQADSALSMADEVLDALASAPCASCLVLHPLTDLRLLFKRGSFYSETIMCVRVPLSFSASRSVEKTTTMTQTERLRALEPYLPILHVLSGGSRFCLARASLCELGLLVWRLLAELLPRATDKKKEQKKKDAPATTWEACVAECCEEDAIIVESIV